jgi:hypothetical protein
VPQVNGTESAGLQARQLPLKRFRAELHKDDKDDARSYARWAGMSLAEVLVSRDRRLELLTTIEIEKYRKQYSVFRSETPTFLSACRSALAFEMSWQYHS